MPIFRPRNRVEIIRSMVARVVARSTLSGLTRNSAVYHIVAAAASEDAEQYFQMARLRELFSIETATGSDLDERAAEITSAAGGLLRRDPLKASGPVEFSRPGTTGAVSIPVGTVVAAEDEDGLIKFETTTSGSIADGDTTSGTVNVVALQGGDRGNVDSGQIKKFVSRVAGVTDVTNTAKFENGRNRESDRSFRARLRSFIQSLSNATVLSIEDSARGVTLDDGRRIVNAKVVEPTTPTGFFDVYVDDGGGSVSEFDDSFLTTPDEIFASASGGEEAFFTSKKPVKDDGAFKLLINSVEQIRGTDYTLNPATGKIVLNSTFFPSGLSSGDTVEAEYRYYINLIAKTQKTLDGDVDDFENFPGVAGGGVQPIVKAATAVFQTVDATIAVASGFDVSDVSSEVKTNIQSYINNLSIGEDVIVAEIVERAMSVQGMFNFKLSKLTGSDPPEDQVILESQVARVASADISLV